MHRERERERQILYVSNKLEFIWKRIKNFSLSPAIVGAMRLNVVTNGEYVAPGILGHEGRDSS